MSDFDRIEEHRDQTAGLGYETHRERVLDATAETLLEMHVHATCDKQEQAAAITARLIEEEGLDATYWNVYDLPSRVRNQVRTQFRYVVFKEDVS